MGFFPGPIIRLATSGMRNRMKFTLRWICLLGGGFSLGILAIAFTSHGVDGDDTSFWRHRWVVRECLGR